MTTSDGDPAAATCVLCNHREDQHETLPDGSSPCRSVGHAKGLTCAECRRLTGDEHVSAIMALRSDPDEAFEVAWAAYHATLDHVRHEIGAEWMAFFTDVHQSALASAVLVLREQVAAPPAPGDGAWGAVWLHGSWLQITRNMTPVERESAAAAVLRWMHGLDAVDGRPPRAEPDELRWWLYD